ncbi:tetratricopeptide repeat protein [Candidatus Gracilibacteria bacterium]|nr:tetratricopeptide repeat protein [Candidatus Gracilibacteria bacterium]MCF7856108.1 tetratricopeptide repeat protein [Candidatus Gracilibacteria bacterium]MCF7896527.1 tetratricopeptide repeat protein [Candidatus Gracilibacteria bacterium]
MDDDKIDELLDQADDLKLGGKYREAIEICEEILAEDPGCVEALEEIGDNFISLNQLKKAEKALRKAVELDSKSANATYLLGFLFSCQRDWENSIEFLEKADDLKSNHSEILRCLGWSVAMAGDRGKGIILLERAKALAPDDTFVLTDLGVCYLNEKNIQKALPIFRRVLEIDPDNEKARECLIIVEEYADRAQNLKRRIN